MMDPADPQRSCGFSDHMKRDQSVWEELCSADTGVVGNTTELGVRTDFHSNIRSTSAKTFTPMLQGFSCSTANLKLLPRKIPVSNFRLKLP